RTMGMGSPSAIPSVQAGIRPGSAFVDGVAALEPVEAERRIERMRPILRDRVGKAPARCRRRLETAIAPAAVEIKIVDRRLADNRTAIHGHIHNARPMPHDA